MATTIYTLEVNGWADFKTTCLAGKKLLMQYIEDPTGYDIYATDSLVWHVRILKGTADATDFENNYKAAANARSNISTVLVDRDGKEIALPVGETAPLSAALFGGVDSDGKVQALRFDGTRLKTSSALTDGVNDVIVGSDGSLQVRVVTPSQGVGAVHEHLETPGGSIEMAINGSGTPVVFSWSPGSHDVDGLSLSLVGEDASIYFGDKFMGISALANGVLIEVKAGDVAYTLYNFQRTREIAQCAASGAFQVFSATPDIVVSQMSLSGLRFKKSGTYATDDYIRATIRDSLIGLNHMSILFNGLEVA